MSKVNSNVICRDLEDISKKDSRQEIKKNKTKRAIFIIEEESCKESEQISFEQEL